MRFMAHLHYCWKLYNWVNEFKRGPTSTRDKPRSGRTVETSTPEIIKKVRNMILRDTTTRCVPK